MTQSTWSLAGTSSCASAGSTGMALTTAHSADAVPYSIRLPQPASLAPVASIISSSRTTILEWVEKTWMDNLKLPQNLVVYAFSMPLQLSLGQIIEIRDMVQRWVRWNILESLAAYHSVVEMLFGIMKNALVRDSLWISHTIAEEISQCLSRDVYILRQQLVAIFRDPEKYTSFLACRGILAQRLLDLLQDLLDSFPRSSTRSRLSKALVRLSRASGLHPTCFPLTDLQIMGHQVAAGAFGDIFRGLIRGQVVVSVKIMRIFLDAEVRAAARAFGREALIWRQLSHPNLLPFFGLYYLETRLCLVSPWMSNGNVLKFLENVLPPDTVRFSLMLDVAMGLEYLHENQVVHGDLKGMNVLVTPSRRACVADFGLSSIVDAMTLQFTHSTTNASGGTLRYQAPELLSGAMQNHYGSDIYAFACVCYEIWTGKAPFFEFILDAPVIFNVLTGIRPSRPTAIPFDHDLWLLLQDCWKKNSCDRPDASQIVQHLVGPTIGAKPAGAAIDWDETNSAKCRRSLHDWPLLPSVNAIERLIFGDDVVDACRYCVPENFEQLVFSKHSEHQGGSVPTQTLSPFSDCLSPPWHPSGILSPAASEYNFGFEEENIAFRSSLRSAWIPISCLSEHDPERHDHGTMHSEIPSPQMCRVFVSTHDLENHSGALQLMPRGRSEVEAPRRSSTPNNFNLLSENYRRMLAQPALDATPDADLGHYIHPTSFHTHPEPRRASTNSDGNYSLLNTPELDPSFTSPPQAALDSFAPTPNASPFSGSSPLLFPPMDEDDILGPSLWRQSYESGLALCGGEQSPT